MRLLRVNEAARELGCSATWLRRAEHRGRIPKAQRDLNGWRRYTEEDIDALRRVLFPSLTDGVGGQGPGLGRPAMRNDDAVNGNPR